MINDNWIEIVEFLRTQEALSTTELKNQIIVENCLRILGWRRANGSMKMDYKNLNTDGNPTKNITLFPNNERNIPALPIIIGSVNTKTQTQLDEIQSSIIEAGFQNVIFWGNEITLFHFDEEEQHIIEICNIQFDTDNTFGSILCDIIDYHNFSRAAFDSFCIDLFNRLPLKKNLRKRFEEILNSEDNLFNAIKKHLLEEGFNENDIINTISTKLFVSKLHCILTKTLPKPVEEEGHQKAESRDTTKFSIDGKNYYPKKLFVLKVIQQYVADNPLVTLEDLEKLFPSRIISKERGVIRPLNVVNEWIEENPDVKTRYCMKFNDIITLKNGQKIVVHNQWGKKHFPSFLEIARTLYNVESDKPYTEDVETEKSFVKEDSVSKSSIQITKQSLDTFITNKN